MWTNTYGGAWRFDSHSARELKKGPTELNVKQHSATTVSSVEGGGH